MNVDRVSGKVVVFSLFGGALLFATLVAIAAKFYFLPAMTNPNGRLDQPTTRYAPDNAATTSPATQP